MFDVKARRSFTDEFKREAVALLQTSGRPLMQIASELGIQPSMLKARGSESFDLQTNLTLLLFEYAQDEVVQLTRNLVTVLFRPVMHCKENILQTHAQGGEPVIDAGRYLFVVVTLH